MPVKPDSCISQVVGDDTRQSLSFIDKAYAYLITLQRTLFLTLRVITINNRLYFMKFGVDEYDPCVLKPNAIKQYACNRLKLKTHMTHASRLKL